MHKCFSIRQATAEVYFSRSDGVQLGVSGPETRYWDDDMTKATFDQVKNNYDKPLFKGICVEFGISSGTDFRFKKGDNHGLRSVFIYVTNFGPSSNFKLLSW